MATTRKTSKKSAPGPRQTAPHPPRLDGPIEIITRFRQICLELPESTEVEAWGHPTFRVKDKIFASAGAMAGVWTFGMKTTHEMQAGLVASDPRFTVAAYVGKHGWVSMRVDEDIDWNQVRALVVESYRMIAPKTLAARVEE
jgi:predicted DNA-binding protein (MmcQ/YjbR family)